MRIAIVATLAVFLAVANLQGFDGDEHYRLAMTALKVASDLAQPREPMKSAVAARLDEKQKPTFGDMTMAVDWFHHVDDLLKVPPEKLREKVHSHDNLIAKGIAAHNNDDHFQDDALEAWRGYHQHAIDNAASQPDFALLNEAIALHYLQDFFSAGHIVTPRKHMHDAVAGHLHDRFNGAGVAFTLADANDETARQVLARLTGTDAYLTAVRTGKTQFHGDSGLACPANAPQKTFVEEISTLSVIEVLEASSPSGERVSLQPCFARRSAEGKPDESASFKNFEGPDGGIRIVRSDSTSVLPIVKCEGSSWFGRYATLRDDRLTSEFYTVLGWTPRVEIATSHLRDVRTNIDLLWFMLAYDPPARLLQRGTDQPLNKSKWLSLTMGGAGPSLTHGHGYHAFGLLYDYYQSSPWRALSWGFRFAPRRYWYEHEHHVKFDYGVKTTMGLDVFSIDLAVDRARHLDSFGRFRPTYFFTTGAEISVSSTWIRHALPFRKACPPVKQE